jgi:tetratricopeptide (TPR) repeat protein
VSEQVDQSQVQQQQTGPQPPPEQLADLMNVGGNGAGAPDLERQALAAAEQALAAGQQALTAAGLEQAPPARRSARETVLRSLLALNLLAMLAVVFLPSPLPSPGAPSTSPSTSPAPTPSTGPAPGAVEQPPAPEQPPPLRRPALDDPVIRAFAAADQRDYRTAIRLLEDHLAASPRLEPSRKANVLLALQHYAAQLGDFARSEEYQHKVEALRSSHSLPEDLLQMANEAEKAGDVESMRRNYARLLLQQRQIPSALFRHVAEAYLKLGDSYRLEAEQASAKSRQQELEELRTKLRQQAAEGRGDGAEGHK